MEKAQALGSKFMQGHDRVHGSKFGHLTRAVTVASSVSDLLRGQSAMTHAIAGRTANRASESWVQTMNRRARQHGPMTAQAYLNEYGHPQVMPFSESLGTPAQVAATRARHAR